MLKRLALLIKSKVSGLSGAAFLLALSAFTSQILGLFRDRLLASHFGTGTELDIYYLSFKVPDLLFLSLGSMFAAVVVIPLLHREKDQNHFFSELLTLAVSVLSLASVVAFFAMPVIIRRLAPGFDVMSQSAAVRLSRILLFSPFFLSLSALFGSALQSRRRFLSYAFSPVAYNIGIIGGILVLAPGHGIAGVVYGVVIGAFLHMAIQVPGILSEGFRLVPNLPRPRDLTKLFVAAFPRTLSLGAQSLSGFVVTSLATLAGTGSVASFQLAYNLQAIPLALVGATFSTAALPVLSELSVSGKESEFRAAVFSAARMIFFLSLVAMIVFFFFSQEVVSLVLGLKPGLALAAPRISVLLKIFSVSVFAQGLVLLLVRAYHAQGLPRIPLVTAILTAAITVILATLFSRNNLFSDPVVGLALAATCAHVFQMLVLGLHFLTTFRHDKRFN